MPSSSRVPGLRAGMVLTVVGMDVFIVQPSVVQTLVEHAGLTESQAGFLAAAEMFGIAVATVLMVQGGRKLEWRVIAGTALAINALSNLACVLPLGVATLTTARFVVGISSGMLIALGYALVGRSNDPDRHFGVLIALVLVYGAAGLLLLPILVTWAGLAGLFGVLTALALVAVPAVSTIPSDGHLTQAHATFGAGGPGGLWLLTSVLAFFLGQGLIWPYLALIGASGGGSADAIALGLTASQLLAIGGAALAAMIGAPRRHGLLLSIGIVASVLPMIVFLGHPPALRFGVAVTVFNVAANFVTPLLMAVVASTGSAQLVVTGVAAQMLGLAIGPALSASVIAPNEYGPAIALGIGAFVLSLLTGLRGRQQMLGARSATNEVATHTA